MKFENQTLNNYFLIKYNSKYSDNIDALDSLNPIFTSYIKKWPTYMDENSQMQSYMIMDKGDKCVGGIFMYPSTANKNDTTMNILLDDNELDYDQEYQVLCEMLEYLSIQLNDKESFTINLYNDIDLTKYNDLKTDFLYKTIHHQTFMWNNKIANVKNATMIQEQEEKIKTLRKNDY